MTAYLTVIPAYGRDYRNQREVLSAWQRGMDFVIASIGPHNGRYISNRDVLPATTHIQVRYWQNQRIVPIPERMMNRGT